IVVTNTIVQVLNQACWLRLPLNVEISAKIPLRDLWCSAKVPTWLGCAVLFRLRATRTNHPSTKGCSRRRHATRSNLQTTWSGWTGSRLAAWHGCGVETSATA